ncbi:hypothetical protein FI667_g5565, partial [Globisporangium splendens]
MSGLNLSQAELLKVGPISSRHSLRLLPLSKKKKKSVYKSLALGGAVTSIHMGSSKGTEDKAFVSTSQHVYGHNKKGKEFFKFQSNLAEAIAKYDNGQDKHSYMSPDKINDMVIFPANHEHDFFAMLGCQDRYLRVVKDSECVAKKSAAAPVTAVCRVQGNAKSSSCTAPGPAQLFYGTANGGLGLVTFNGEKLKTKWKVSNNDSALSAINSIASFDLNKDDHPEILVGRDDGRVEVYSFDAQSGEVTKQYEYVNTDSVRCVQGGITSTPGFEELVAATFSGRVISFTTEPLDQPDADDSYGRSHGTVHRETRIVKLRKEIGLLEEKIVKEKDRSLRSREKEYLPVAEDLVVNHKSQLNPALGAYDVSIEIPVNIQAVVLHSAVPIDLLENEKNHAIVSKSPPDPANNTHFLATYRCLEQTHRLEFSIRTIEGQYGDIEVTVITDVQPKATQCVKFYVKPLSLHHRVNEVDESALKMPTNTLQFSGPFTLVQIHDWVSMCLPEVPGRLQDEEVTMYYKNTFLGNLLLCRYRKGEATFSSPSVSVIVILKEVITKEAMARKVTLNMSLDVKKETIPVMLGFLRPLLDSKHALASQVKLIESIKELQMHEDDYLAWMAPEYQHILNRSEQILSEFQASPKAINYLAGVLTDLYVDLCKFRGTNVKQNLPRLYQLIEHYHFDSLVDFYLCE